VTPSSARLSTNGAQEIVNISVNYVKPFFQLLRNELWQQGTVPTALSLPLFSSVQRFARQQTVWGLVSNSIVRNNVKTGDDNAMEAMGTTITHQRTAQKMQSVMVQIAEALEGRATADNNGQPPIPYAVFKGQAVAVLYPTPHCRTLGDIDIYFPKEHFQRGVERIEQCLGISVHREELDKHYDCELDDVRIELHYRVETFGSSRHQRYFDRMVDADICTPSPTRIDIGGVGVRTFSPMVHTLVVFKHLFNHFLVEGVGLRQFCDMAMLLHHYHDAMPADALQRHLRGMGYRRAFLATTMLLVKKLGMPEADSPLPLSEQRDTPWARRLLEEAAQRGNFGANDRHADETSQQKSLNTARVAMRHCLQYMPLAWWDILCLIPRRIGVTLRRHLRKNNDETA